LKLDGKYREVKIALAIILIITLMTGIALIIALAIIWIINLVFEF
jgi:hypothetical protein